MSNEAGGRHGENPFQSFFPGRGIRDEAELNFDFVVNVFEHPITLKFCRILMREIDFFHEEDLDM